MCSSASHSLASAASTSSLSLRTCSRWGRTIFNFKKFERCLAFQVLNHYFGELDYRVYMAVTLLPMLLLVSIRNLKYLSPVSMLANLLQFVGLGIIFYYLLQDIPLVSERKVFATWGQLPLYFGTAIYAFEGIGIVLPLENSMKTPSDMKVDFKKLIFLKISLQNAGLEWSLEHIHDHCVLPLYSCGFLWLSQVWRGCHRQHHS